jgi:hypothetical protein
MSCAAVEAVLVDLARGQDVAGEDRAAALAHALRCERCADRFAAERAASDGLRALAEWTAAAEAPARLEQALRAALQERVARRSGISRGVFTTRSGWWWPAAAAAVVAIAVVWTGSRGAGVGPAVGSPGAVAPQAASPASPVASDENGFIPLTWGPPLSELDGMQVVHVQMPASALPSLGWAVAGEPLGETVEADVLVGADGVARALRILHSASEGTMEDNGGHS